MIDDEKTWTLYNEKQDIKELILSLNKKGIRERKLYDNIIALINNNNLEFNIEDLKKNKQNEGQ